MNVAIVDGNGEVRGWLFDFDNTLAAMEKQVDWAASRRELEAFLRSQAVDEAIFTEFPSGNLLLYNALLLRLHRDCGTAALMRRASAVIEAYELRGVDHAPPLPGARELLFALTAINKRIAIVTSNSSRTVTRWLGRHNVAFEIPIVGRDSLLPLKPSPKMVYRALELIDVSAAEAVLIGDSEADLRAAHGADVSFLAVAAASDARTRLAALGARQVFASPAELARHFHL
jgi:beta-phosphoglucomutase-like phosphatase (HAD superfamily)